MKQDWKLIQSFQKKVKLMSDKDRYVASVRKARAEHGKWLNAVKVMVSGFEKNKDLVALNQSESPFGVWLNEEAILLSTINSKAALIDVEEMFNECYSLYHKIYHRLFNTKNSSLLSSVFGINKVSVDDLKLSEHYYEELVKKSDQLTNKLRVYENQVQANGEEKFEGLYAKETIFIKEESVEIKTQRYYRGSLISDD